MFKIIMKVGFTKAPNDFKYKFIWGQSMIGFIIIYNINFTSEFNYINDLS